MRDTAYSLGHRGYLGNLVSSSRAQVFRQNIETAWEQNKVFVNEICVPKSQNPCCKKTKIHSLFSPFLGLIAYYFSRERFTQFVSFPSAYLDNRYELAYALSAEHVSHAIATRISLFLLSFSHPRTLEEGNIASFFVRVLGQALVPKACPHRPQTFKRVNIGKVFP